VKIIVNGVEQQVTAKTMAELVTEMGYEDVPVATARNQAVVAKRNRTTTHIQEGDRIEILIPMQGG
jgi:sulfur carrier protein